MQGMANSYQYGEDFCNVFTNLSANLQNIMTNELLELGINYKIGIF